jgi:short-subunit dehydrogenase
MFIIDDYLWALFSYVAGWIGLISCLTYAIAQIVQLCCRPQNLKAKYDAEWALVTGASSGIGKCITERLADQGVNVVLVALDDKVLAATFAEVKKAYPKVTFRCVGVNLGAHGAYMPEIVAKTSDIFVNLVFNNAGFILPGLFADQNVNACMANYECNATSSMLITHHFMGKMIAAKRTGLISFTSSAGAYFPGPTAALYSSTKAFLTSFATSIAGEVRDVGIDIVVVHPSPIASSFYEKTASVLSSLKTAQKAASSPFVIADAINASAGRLVVWDQGSTSVAFRLVTKTIDFAFFNELTSRVAYIFNPDHAKLAKESKLRKGNVE